MTASLPTDPTASRRTPWRFRAAVLIFIAFAICVVWVTNTLLTERFTESTRNRAEVRLTSYTGQINSELQRSSVVPLLLARDPALIGALNSGDHTQSSQRLIAFREEINAASLLLLDADGRAVAASDRNILGSQFRSAPFFVNALRSNDTVFTATALESGGTRFSYSRKMDAGNEQLGVVVVEVDLGKFERNWAGFSDAVIVTDSEGRIILSTESRWRGRTEEEALQLRSVPSAISRAVRATADWTGLPPDAYIAGEAVMRQEMRVGFQGWKLTSFTTYAGVRDRVNSIIALQIMAFAIIVAAGFYLRSRNVSSRLVFFQRESAELRQLNEALQREIAERERAEKNLEVAEQTIQQSSKLAVLGEMSAAVSHELNQPLAAMKTYLAGAKLLLQRNRPDEALSSFQRIDDLIERMGAITRQLKSYARKGGDAFEIVDLRAAILSALEMMEPQLRQRGIAVERRLPRAPVLAEVDRMRLEQVVVNLVRNALDATLSVENPAIEVLLAEGEDITIAVRDNGSGIEDLDSLFEPFYTTKKPGDGVGLGLAISSSIVNDLGGRLTARNGSAGGAVFEVRLPRPGKWMEAAE